MDSEDHQAADHGALLMFAACCDGANLRSHQPAANAAAMNRTKARIAAGSSDGSCDASDQRQSVATDALRSGVANPEQYSVTTLVHK